MEPTSNSVTREQLILDCERQVKLLTWQVARKLYENMYEDLLSVAWIDAIQAVDRHDPEKGKLSTIVKRRVTGALLDYLRAIDPLTRGQRKKAKRDESFALVHIPLSDQIVDKADYFQHTVTAVSLDSALRKTCLTRNERLVLMGLNFKFLAGRWGVTQSRISHINTGAIKKIRKVVFQ